MRLIFSSMTLKFIKNRPFLSYKIYIYMYIDIIYIDFTPMHTDEMDDLYLSSNKILSKVHT